MRHVHVCARKVYCHTVCAWMARRPSARGGARFIIVSRIFAHWAPLAALCARRARAHQLRKISGSGNYTHEVAATSCSSRHARQPSSWPFSSSSRPAARCSQEGALCSFIPRPIMLQFGNLISGRARSHVERCQSAPSLLCAGPPSVPAARTPGSAHPPAPAPHGIN